MYPMFREIGKGRIEAPFLSIQRIQTALTMAADDRGGPWKRRHTGGRLGRKRPGVGAAREGCCCCFFPQVRSLLTTRELCNMPVTRFNINHCYINNIINQKQTSCQGCTLTAPILSIGYDCSSPDCSVVTVVKHSASLFHDFVWILF